MMESTRFDFKKILDYIPSSFYTENAPEINSILQTICEVFNVLFEDDITNLTNLRNPDYLTYDFLLLLLSNLGFQWNGVGAIDHERLRYLANYLPYYHKIAGSGAVAITDSTKTNQVWIMDESHLGEKKTDEHPLVYGTTILANDWM